MIIPPSHPLETFFLIVPPTSLKEGRLTDRKQLYREPLLCTSSMLILSCTVSAYACNTLRVRVPITQDRNEKLAQVHIASGSLVTTVP